MSARVRPDGPERRRRALEAATTVARLVGLEASKPRLLKDSNNTVIHLHPERVVAKVSTGHLDPYGRASLADELAIGTHLAARGAPVAPPLSEGSPGPFTHDGLTVTLWELREHDASAVPDDREIAQALRSFHTALADYPGELPAFTVHLDAVRVALERPESTPELGADDRRFLLEVHDRLGARLAAAPSEARALHGGPHLDGNVLLTDDGPLLVDFEAACRGPLEWDLSYLPESIARHFGEADPDLLDTFRDVTSVCVAAWCWTQPWRAPELAEAARFHLERLRSRASAG